MNPLATALLALSSLVLLALLLAGCTGPGEPPGSLPPEGLTPDQTYPPGPLPGSGQRIAAAHNLFALDLYGRLAGDPARSGENLFFSPLSISAAMTLTYEGARGATAAEIREVFHLPGDSVLMREGYREVTAGINQGSAAYELRTANALWAERTYRFLPGYVRVAGDAYGANATNLDFATQPEASRTTINRWVSDQTHDRIEDLLPEGSITPLTRLVITNAVYFKGTWVKQFDEEKTTDEEFRTGNGETVLVPMMQRTDRDATFGYWETDFLQVLQMPYQSGAGNPLSMVVLLPREGDLSALEQNLTPMYISAFAQNLTTRRVTVFIPKFTMEATYSLPGTLSAMGMPTAFTPGADFSGMDGTRDLFIQNVIHKAFVEVNEEGTEAAAATGVVVGLAAAPVEEPVPVFRADHPFVFLIQDDETGLILFMGRVENPVSS